MQNFKWGLSYITFLLALVLADFLACGGDSKQDRRDGGEVSQDSGKNDEGDDDNEGGDETPDAPPKVFGWLLLDNNDAKIKEALEKAEEYKINHIQLSHGIIHNIDDLLDESRLEKAREYARIAKSKKMKVYAWAHEFTNINKFDVCFDPDEPDPIFAERAEVYRRALTAAPEIDGIILMFGSSDVEPWIALCSCRYCRQLEGENPLLKPPPPVRLQMIIETIKKVVVEELGKEIILRTFNHEPQQQKWVIEAFNNEPLEYAVMAKDQVQDWQPYYPMDSAFGNVGERPQIVELDFAGEYWGKSAFPMPLADYFRWRFDYAFSKGAIGFAGRIERGASRALGTHNEINIYAATRFTEEPELSAETVWEEWINKRYGLEAESELEAMKKAMRNAFDTVRKMYYTLGFWTLSKSSEVPTGGRKPEQLEYRNNAKWLDTWRDEYERLNAPDESVLADIHQEKLEALSLVNAAIEEVESLREALSPADYESLSKQLEHLSKCVEIWRQATDAVFRYRLFSRSASEEQGRLLEGTLTALALLADEMEAAYGNNIETGNPQKIRQFIADIRSSFPEGKYEAELYEPEAKIGVPEAFDITADGFSVTYEGEGIEKIIVEYGYELSDLEYKIDLSKTEEGKFTGYLGGLKPGGWSIYRARATTATGDTLLGGDFRQWTR